jgi:hypothetical protein
MATVRQRKARSQVATSKGEAIADLMLEQMQYQLSADARAALEEYIERRQALPHFANARSIRNALDRARLRQASRLFAKRDAPLARNDLMTIEAADIRASRVFAETPPTARQGELHP